MFTTVKSPLGDLGAICKAPRPPKGGVEKVKPSVLKSANPMLYEKLSFKAKDMRCNPTKAESVLWEVISNRQTGVKFRQQHIIDKFIVDFCSIGSGLIIEIDGKVHDLQKEADSQRTNILEAHGYVVIRFTNDEVLNDLTEVLKKIENHLIKKK